MPSTTTQRFFVEGELQERRQWKDSPLLLDDPIEPEAMEYTSFDRIPRRWTPLIMAGMLVGLVAMGGAIAVGLWTPPAPWVEWARRMEQRLPRMRAAAQTPSATVNPPASAPPASAPPASAALLSETPRQPSPTVSEPEAQTPPVSEPVAAAPAVAQAGTGVESASVDAIPGNPGARSERTVASAPAATALPARAASSPQVTAAEPSAARQEPARRPTERARGRGNGLRGYVWSPQFGALVPVTSGAAPDAPASWKPASPAAPVSAAPERPPTSVPSATEPPPIPVAPIQPPKALPEPTEMAAPSPN